MRERNGSLTTDGGYLKSANTGEVVNSTIDNEKKKMVTQNYDELEKIVERNARADKRN